MKYIEYTSILLFTLFRNVFVLVCVKGDDKDNYSLAFGDV